MNKKLLLVSALSVTLLFTGCSKKDETKAKTTTPTNTTTANTTDPKSTNENNPDGTTNENETPKASSSKVDKEVLKNLVDNSDYISRIKIQVTQDNATDINYIEDYKGDLSGIELELPKTLKSNKEYIIFYVDGVNGKITPTRDDESYVEIQGENDASLDYIENIFEVEETPKVSSEPTDKTAAKTADTKK